MRIRLGLAMKLLCVCLAFGLPIVVMSVLMTQAKLGEIEFGEKELAGDAFQRPLESVLEHVARHRRLRLQQSSGAPMLSTALLAEQSAIDAALARLEIANQDHGSELQFTADGLGLRGRSENTVEGLRDKWLALRSSLSTAGAVDIDQAHVAIVAHVRTMITHAGDTSNLILDPDLDSYYLMDVTLLALPQMEDRIQQIAADVETTLGAGVLGADDRRRLATLSAFLKEADWDRVKVGVNTAITEDANFHGTSPSLTSLIPLLEVCAAKMTPVVAALDGASSTGAASDFDLARFREDVDGLEKAVYAFHHAAFDEEDRLITKRLRDFESSLHLGFVLAAGSVAVSVLLAFALSTNILRRLRRLSAATEAFANGALDVRIGNAGQDELGQLARAFDGMTTRIGGLTAEVLERAKELEQVNGNLERLVDERTHELKERNVAFRLILDNAHDGMLTSDLSGVVSSERSAVVDIWFGAPTRGARLGDYLCPDNPTLAAEFALGLEALAADALPMELTLDQLPRRMTTGDRKFRITYQPILEGGAVARLLLVLSDVTREVEGQKAAALQEDVLRIFQACQRDRPGFLNFFFDSRELVQRIALAESATPIETRRAIHTLNGNCALFGVLRVSALCHAVENNMEDNGGIASPADVERIRDCWAELSVSIAEVLGDGRYDSIELADTQYIAIVEAIAQGAPRRDILDAIARWKLEPAERRFRRLGVQAERLARRLGKEVTVSIEANDVRLCADTWSPVWSALSHAIRNAVDHGIDPMVERVKRGVPALGSIRLAARMAGGDVILEVSDDGRGVDWGALSKKAAAAHLPHRTRDDLMEALFADGISSRSVLTDVSGRGVGMGALRQACEEIGGRVAIESEPFHGTTVRCSFPEAVMGGPSFASLKERPISPSLTPS